MPSNSVATRLHARTTKRGFTIVELLIVIVIIGILAALAIVSYNGIQQRSTGASIQADLKDASTKLKLYQVDNSAFPTSNDCSTGITPAPPKICLKSGAGNTYSYTYDNASIPQAFNLKATNGNLAYVITHDSAPTLVTALTCPTGFIVVPGSSTYGTADFCTMKYVASRVGATTTPISQTGTTPWVYISQQDALANSPNVAGCTGCHLITEPEFMTISQNVLGVPSNWSGGVVGSGFIYSGHNDNTPTSALAADSNDNNGYAGTGNSSPSNQRRTLTLSNGEVIWDLVGNVWEWTSGTSTTGQPGIIGEAGYSSKQWSAVNTLGSSTANPSPAGTNLAGANSWNTGNGVGQLYSFTGETAVRGFLRGGSFNYGGGTGLLNLNLNYVPTSTNAAFGFRVSK